MLFVRLLVVMGVFWILEATSMLISNKWQTYLDIFNGLQGVVIFVLFILKPNVLTLIKQRSVILFLLKKDDWNHTISLNIQYGHLLSFFQMAKPIQ